jgi:hypothetical protein
MHHVLDLAEAVVVVGWDKNCHPTEQDIAKPWDPPKQKNRNVSNISLPYFT